ncbi:unnamed protein product [Bathycoccus prasinos]
MATMMARRASGCNASSLLSSSSSSSKRGTKKRFVFSSKSSSSLVKKKSKAEKSERFFFSSNCKSGSFNGVFASGMRRRGGACCSSASSSSRCSAASAAGDDDGEEEEVKKSDDASTKTIEEIKADKTTTVTSKNRKESIPKNHIDAIIPEPTERPHERWVNNKPYNPMSPTVGQCEPLPKTLPKLSRGERKETAYDLLIVGCGPAGLYTSTQASEKGLKVALIDPKPLAGWRNNYGVWCDEFQALGFEDCYRASWPRAQVIFGDADTPEENDRQTGKFLDRAYAQVDRAKLKSKLIYRAMENKVEFGTQNVKSVKHDEDDVSEVTLSDGSVVFAKMVLDATGHARKLVDFEREFTPGYQAAFGIVCDVESHPFPLDTMLFMDWRDDHLDDAYKSVNDILPTFLYAMPFSNTQVFLEETSLVARPGLEFDDLKVKLKQRLERLGVKVTRVEEEEYCLIPMGGVLPAFPQRTLGIGGTAGMVHPSTGFMVAKTMRSANVLVDAIFEALRAGKSGMDAADLVDESIPASDSTLFSAKSASEDIWKKVWTEEDLRVRTFMCFGMETLMELDIKGTRQFFKTFFNLPRDVWGGFLSWNIGPTGLLSLGIALFASFNNYMRYTFVTSALPFMGSFFANFASAQNKFDSSRWGGAFLEINTTPKKMPPTLPGYGGIPTPKKAKMNFSETLPTKDDVSMDEDEEEKEEKEEEDDDDDIDGVSGEGVYEKANPTEKPILKSPLDFEKLLQGELSYTSDSTNSSNQVYPEVKIESYKDDREWIAFQQRKVFPDQQPIVDVLDVLKTGEKVDCLIIGAGPAGLAIAAETAKKGLSVGVVAPDAPFVNNYGVWLDEFKAIGLEHTLLHKYEDTLVWYDDSDPESGRSLGRPYGQVCRRRLREHLLSECKKSGVKYLPGIVDRVQHFSSSEEKPSEIRGRFLKTDASSRGNYGEGSTDVDLAGVANDDFEKDFEVFSDLVVCSTGHNREMLRYESGPPPGWQTAYGIEVTIPNHPWEKNKAVFMDFRQADPELKGEMRNSRKEDGSWRVPSFLYVLPVDENTVFVEETCLVARVQIPFDELKRRLYRRLTRMGVEVDQEKIIEEEASWIPLGGTPPVSPQRTLAYGAAAGMVNPASGYSITKSLGEAPGVAEAIYEGFQKAKETKDYSEISHAAWDRLWGYERRRQIGFYQFGMELLISLRIEQMRNFFGTFFGLPIEFNRGFLASKLNSVQLLQFAMMMFFQGNNDLRGLLLAHLVTEGGSGVRLFTSYTRPILEMLEIDVAGLEEKDGKPKSLQTADGINLLDRNIPPQDRNTNIMMREFQQSLEQGMTPGFSGRDWWKVGSSSSSSGNGSNNNSNNSNSSMAASASPMVTRESQTTEYWSNGSQSMVKTVVKNTGLSEADLYGNDRNKFLPKSIINLPGENVIVPPHLTGGLPGDIGFDPLKFGAQSDLLKFRERELINGRWAMLAAIGVLLPEFLFKFGLYGEGTDQHWWSTKIIHDVADGWQLTYMGSEIPWGLFWLPIIHLPLMFVAEMLRTGKFEIERFSTLDKLYPGGRLFDPLGLAANQSEEEVRILKAIEIQHCRLAMLAFSIFCFQGATGKGPLDFF